VTNISTALLQDSIIKYLKTSRIADGYPSTIKSYSGELFSVDKLLTNVPAILVNLRSGLTDLNTAAGRFGGITHQVELILADINYESGEAQGRTIYDLIDWCVNKLRGAKIRLDGLIPEEIMRVGQDISYDVVLTDQAENAIVFIGLVKFEVF
jgi:hypothetical protein